MWPFSRRRQKAVPFSMMTGSGSAQWSGRDYSQFSDQGYRKNIIAYRSISVVSRGVASVPWVAFVGEDEAENHPVLALLKKPNPRQGGAAFMEAMSAFYLIAGNSYTRRIGPGDSIQSEPKELWNLRPDRTAILTGDMGNVLGYKYQVNSKTRIFDVDPITGESEVMHMRTFHPLDDYYGMSPLEAASYSIDQHNAAGQWNYKLLKNSARPSGALIYAPKDGDGNMTDEQHDKLKRELIEQQQGSENTGRPMLLEGGLNWKEMSLNPKDMDFINAKNTSSRDIAQAYGVPSMLAGVVGDATFANFKEARLALWEDTIIPLLEVIKDELNRWLGKLYNPEVTLDYNTDEVPALAHRRQDTWEKLEGVSYLTINEKREAIGYEPVDGGDVIMVPAMNIPLGFDGDELASADDVPIKEAAEMAYGR